LRFERFDLVIEVTSVITEMHSLMSVFDIWMQ